MVFFELVVNVGAVLLQAKDGTTIFYVRLIAVLFGAVKYRKRRTMTADELEKLAKAATPGEWEAAISKRATHWAIRHSARGKGDGYNNRVAETCQWSPATGPQITPTESEANAALIAAMCSEPARNRIIAALRLVERIEAGDHQPKLFGKFSDYWNRICTKLPNRAWSPDEQRKHAYEEGYREGFVAALSAIAKELGDE